MFICDSAIAQTAQASPVPGIESGGVRNAPPRPSARPGAAPPTPAPSPTAPIPLGPATFANPAAPALRPAQPWPAERLAAIKAKGELGICIWAENYGLSWRNPRSAELEGLDIDMARTLATRLSVRPTFVETNFLEYADRLDNGDCDIAMMAIGITSARSQRVAFSKPYLASGVYAVASREANRVTSWNDLDRPGIAVGVAAGTAFEGFLRENLRHAELVPIRPPATREQELQAGRVDAFVADFAYTRRVSSQNDWARLIEPPARYGETLYAYALPRNELGWLNEVNAFLASVKSDGTLARSANRYGLSSIVMY